MIHSHIHSGQEPFILYHLQFNKNNPLSDMFTRSQQSMFQDEICWLKYFLEFLASFINYNENILIEFKVLYNFRNRFLLLIIDSSLVAKLLVQNIILKHTKQQLKQYISKLFLLLVYKIDKSFNYFPLYAFIYVIMVLSLFLTKKRVPIYIDATRYKIGQNENCIFTKMTAIISKRKY